MNNLVDDKNLQNENSNESKLENKASSFNHLAYIDTVNVKNNVNDNFNFSTLPTIDNTNSVFHNHRMSAIKSSHHHISNTVDQYSRVSAQLKSTFQIFNSRQSISSTSSSSSSTESTSSSLPSSIELIVKSKENLFKSTESLLKSDEFLIQSANPSLLSENLFKCLSITDESLELNNLLSSSSSLDSSSFENIYSLFPINKRPNSNLINKSKTTQELNIEQIDEKLRKKKRRSLCDKKILNDEPKARNYLIKETISKDNEELSCRINLIELSLKNRKSLTVVVKWPLKSKLNQDKDKDKLFSIQFRKTEDDQLMNVHIRY